jgi:hypothetical protein
VLRSLNNLIEPFHHFTWFYWLIDPDQFLPMPLYIPILFGLIGPHLLQISFLQTNITRMHHNHSFFNVIMKSLTFLFLFLLIRRSPQVYMDYYQKPSQNRPQCRLLWNRLGYFMVCLSDLSLGGLFITFLVSLSISPFHWDFHRMFHRNFTIHCNWCGLACSALLRVLGNNTVRSPY